MCNVNHLISRSEDMQSSLFGMTGMRGWKGMGVMGGFLGPGLDGVCAMV